MAQNERNAVKTGPKTIEPEPMPSKGKSTKESTAADSRKKYRRKSGSLFSGRNLVTSFVYAIPFLAVAASTLRCGVALSFAMALVIIPGSLLCFILREKAGAPLVLTVAVGTLVSMALASVAAWAVRRLSVELTDALGVYIYLIAAYPVLAAVFAEKGTQKLSGVLDWAVRYTVRFTAAALLLSAIREILAYGQVWGISLGWQFQLTGARMTFFGLILMAMLLAGVSALRNLAEQARIRRHAGAEQES